ncbi:MAG: hypothetical protein U0T69_03185 [Chitinophagales bacterium]
MDKYLKIIILIISIVFASIFIFKSCNAIKVTTTVVNNNSIKKDRKDHIYYYLPIEIFEIVCYYDSTKKEYITDIRRLFVPDYSSLFDLCIENGNIVANNNNYTVSLNDNGTLDKIELNSTSNVADNINFGINVATSILKVGTSNGPIVSRENTFEDASIKSDTFKYIFIPKSIKNSLDTTINSCKIKISFIRLNDYAPENTELDRTKYEGVIGRQPLTTLMQIDVNGKIILIKENIPQFGMYQYHKLPISKYKDIKTNIEFYPDGSLKSKVLTNSNNIITKFPKNDITDIANRIIEAIRSSKP